ncbi:MAG: HAD-IA family hydrolase [Gemmataceae bacterium]
MTPAFIPPDARAVFFDAVGTVIHPSVGAPAVYARAAARYGVNLTADEVFARFTAAYRVEERADAAAGWVTSEGRERDRWRAIVSAALPGSPSDCFDELFAHFGRPDAWAVPPEASELFDRLSTCGVVIGLASNYDRRLRSVVDGRPELSPLRERVVVSSEVGFRKPAAAFFRAVVAAAGCRADQIVFVGDDVGNDFRGATAAGMRAVLLDPADRHPGQTPRVRSLAELLDR